MAINGSTAGWTVGKAGGAFQFNGTNNAATPAKDVVADPGAGGAVAVAGWFRTSTTANRVYLFQFETIYEMRMKGGGLQVSFRGNAGSAPLWGEGLNDGLWHHFVAQNTGSATELYIDGALVGSRGESSLALSIESRRSAIAAKQNESNPFPGAMDDVRYYIGALTPAEIEALAQVSNRPPKAADDAYTASVNDAFTVPAPGVLANDSDRDGDALQAVLKRGPSQGTLVLQADGLFTFTPPSGFTGVLSFDYIARDKDGDSNTATVTLTVLDPSTSLTPSEVAKIETDLGITLSQQEKLDLAAIVKPQALPAWRSEANLRIEANRKANLAVEVVDASGNPVPGASVRAVLARHKFTFGGVGRVMDLTDAAGNLAAGGSTPADWQRLVKALFNAVGLDNAFKPKTTSQHQYLPNFLNWAAANHLPVRGHLLLWPGGGDLEDLDNPDAISGVDYGDRLSNASTSAYASHNVLGAVDAYKASARGQADRDALASVVNAEIAEWASRWDVYEWDVLNETINNVLLQEILGYGRMAEWLQLAGANKVNPAARLLINDYQIISASFAAGSTIHQTRRDTYFNRIDQIRSAGAPLDGIGFQSRFKFFDGYSPAAVYSRLEEFAARYPDLDLVGTEFEIPDWYDYFTGALIQAYDEQTRARLTEEILTTYFSHPRVTGLTAWDFMNPLPDGTGTAYSRALCHYGDGPGGAAGPITKLNGLVWFYLHRIRYHTDNASTTGPDGRATLRGFKGDYNLTVAYEGKEYPAATTLDADGTVRVTLGDVIVDAGPAGAIVIDRWTFDDPAETELKNALNSSGTTAFSTATPACMTDGAGRLAILRHPTATSAGSGYFISSGSLTMGPRTSGRYELDFTITSADLSGGSASGAMVGLALRDSSAGKELFAIRLNKTSGGLALSSYIDGVYTQLHLFSGMTRLTSAVRIRSVADLDAGTAAVYLTQGAGAEEFKGTVALGSLAANLDRLQFFAVNNSTNWGPTDRLEIEEITFRKRDPETYSAWRDGIDWQGAALTGEWDDADGDSLVNALERALGGNPVSADAASVAPRIVQLPDGPAIECTLGIDSLDALIQAEFSTDLADWTSIPPVRLHGAPGSTVVAPLPGPGSAGRIFTRISLGAP